MEGWRVGSARRNSAEERTLQDEYDRSQYRTLSAAVNRSSLLKGDTLGRGAERTDGVVSDVASVFPLHVFRLFDQAATQSRGMGKLTKLMMCIDSS